jgi:hypothetical protein
MMMVIMMNDSKLNSMAQIKSFLAETKEMVFNKKSQSISVINENAL